MDDLFPYALHPYTVIYRDYVLQMIDHRTFWARDSEHARELCDIRYPGVDVIWVNPGHDNTSMREMEEPGDPL